MSFTLFKHDLKRYWKIILIFIVVLLFYFAMIVSMFDPEGAQGLQEMIKMMPESMIKMMGMSAETTTFTSSLGNYFYGMIVFMFPTICFIIMANGLVAKHVDSGSMASLLSTPNTRIKIVSTQAIFLLGSLTVMIGALTVGGILLSQAMFPDQLEIGNFLLMNLSVYITYLALTGISFCASCVCNDTGKSLMFGAGIPIAFFLMKMMGQTSHQIQWMADCSLYSLYTQTEIATTGKLDVTATIVLLSIAILTYAGAFVVFKKKNLPL